MDHSGCLEYINQHIEWFDKRAVKSKRRYIASKTIIMIATTSITLMAAIGGVLDSQCIRYITIFTALLAAIATILEMYSQLKQDGILYIIYRETCEFLEQEKIFFLVGVSPYDRKDEQDNIKLLIERCQKCRSKARDEWSRNIKSGMKEN